MENIAVNCNRKGFMNKFSKQMQIDVNMTTLKQSGHLEERNICKLELLVRIVQDTHWNDKNPTTN